MIPTSRPTRNVADVPALVLYAGRRALVLHPDGPEHENVAATRTRLQHHGYVVITVPEDPAPFLAGVSQYVRAEVRRLLAAVYARETGR